MTLIAQTTFVVDQLVAWFNARPGTVRVAIIVVMMLALAAWTYSVVHAMPLTGGGSGCGC